jgi:hypothetical protein
MKFCQQVRLHFSFFALLPLFTSTTGFSKTTSFPPLGLDCGAEIASFIGDLNSISLGIESSDQSVITNIQAQDFARVYSDVRRRVEDLPAEGCSFSERYELERLRAFFRRQGGTERGIHGGTERGIGGTERGIQGGSERGAAGSEENGIVYNKGGSERGRVAGTPSHTQRLSDFDVPSRMSAGVPMARPRQDVEFGFNSEYLKHDVFKVSQFSAMEVVGLDEFMKVIESRDLSSIVNLRSAKFSLAEEIQYSVESSSDVDTRVCDEYQKANLSSKFIIGLRKIGRRTPSEVLTKLNVEASYLARSYYAQLSRSKRMSEKAEAERVFKIGLAKSLGDAAVRIRAFYGDTFWILQCQGSVPNSLMLTMPPTRK